MVVRDKVRTEPPHEGARYTQIAVLEDGVVVEHFVTSAASASLVGNIYLGIVQNVLPSMEAAFVDIGRGRNGVLYAGEVNWEAAGLGGANRKIEQALKPGDYVVVQVSKDPVGHKGARLTTQVSLAGRYLVYVPGASSTGISRKLPDTERQRLKEILREVVPADAGVIIRTASEGVKEEDIRSDVERLQKRWTEIEAKAAETTKKAAGAAVALYEEPDVLVKVIRDLFNEDFTGLIVSGDDAWYTINEYVNSVAPELVPRLTKYEPAADGPDVFAVHRIDEQLTKAMDRKVWLPSGGTLVIDRTEAMTVVDVNTGKFTGSGGNLEQTVTRNNLEAAEEIVRQLRLRDIGGIVVIDFIDMVLESNRDLVLRRLTESLARDRTRHQVSEVTSLGLVQLTRKRLGTGLIEAFSTPCPHCGGRGILLHGDPVDSTSTTGRKSDSGGRRGKRGKKGGRADDVAVAKVPAHPAGEHPMFKAMAAANGKHEDEDDDGEGEDRRPPRKSPNWSPTPSARRLSRPRTKSSRTTTSTNPMRTTSRRTTSRTRTRSTSTPTTRTTTSMTTSRSSTATPMSRRRRRLTMRTTTRTSPTSPMRTKTTPTRTTPRTANSTRATRRTCRSDRARRPSSPPRRDAPRGSADPRRLSGGVQRRGDRLPAVAANRAVGDGQRRRPARRRACRVRARRPVHLGRRRRP